MQDILIFPCNGNGREALDCLGAQYRCVGFVDDTPEKQGTQVAGIPVLSRVAFAQFPQAKVLAVPGGPASYKQRKSIIENLAIPADRFATVIHPKASVSAQATIGQNVLIMAGVVITSNATIGHHVCILPNTVIHHDAEVKDWTLIGSGVVIAGSVVIEKNAYIGSATAIKNGVVIGEGCLIGIGSNVIRDVLPHQVMAGNPARPLTRPVSS